LVVPGCGHGWQCGVVIVIIIVVIVQPAVGDSSLIGWLMDRGFQRVPACLENRSSIAMMQRTG